MKNLVNQDMKGYSFKKRKINYKVQIFFPSEFGVGTWDPILYIYYDKQGNIEDYFLGGS